METWSHACNHHRIVSSDDVSDERCVYGCVLRSRRTLESRQNMDDDKIMMLEDELRKAKSIAIEAERNYEEVVDLSIS